MYIYKITAPDGRCYIGSTTITMAQRWSVHKSGFLRCMLGKSSFCASYNLFMDYDPDECSIDILELFPEGTERSEILARERHHIQTYPCVNDYGRKTDEMKADAKREYYAANKEVWRKSYKDYYMLNTEKEKQRQRDYYAKNKERIAANYKAKKATLLPAPATTS